MSTKHELESENEGEETRDKVTVIGTKEPAKTDFAKCQLLSIKERTEEETRKMIPNCDHKWKEGYGAEETFHCPICDVAYIWDLFSESPTLCGNLSEGANENCNCSVCKFDGDIGDIYRILLKKNKNPKDREQIAKMFELLG